MVSEVFSPVRMCASSGSAGPAAISSADAPPVSGNLCPAFSEREGSGAMLRDERVRQAIPTGRVMIVEAVLSVPLIETTLGWMYKDAPLKVGSPLSFETAAYTMDGGVVDVTVDAATPAAAEPKPGAIH